jgi:AcrR family transcriptional regulator
LSPDGKPGLRERKKAKTRAAIQHHALRLFREQGYDATTVAQIAEAAEVSEATFFRYFRTKEDVVLWDEFDPLLIESFRSQPAELSPIQALRAAFRAVYSGLTEEEWEEQRARMELYLGVPELRSATLGQFFDMVPVISEMVAERTGRSPEDPAARTFAGAVIGVAFSVLGAAAKEPASDWVRLIDEALEYVEDGLPL